MAQKAATVYIVDCGPSMALPVTLSKGQEGNEQQATITTSGLEMAQQMLESMLHDKLMAGRKTDQTAILLCGSDQTKNSLASDDGQYQNIEVIQEFAQPFVDQLRQVAGIQPGTGADCLDSVVVAVDMLINFCKKLKYEKKVYLITNGLNPINQEGVEQIAQEIKAQNVQLSVIGIGFQDSDEEIQLADTEPTTLEKNELFFRKFTRELLEGTDSELYTADEALEVFQQVRKKKVSATTLFRGALEFGKAFSIPISMYSRTSEMKLPTAKKLFVTDDGQTMESAREFNYRIINAPSGDVDDGEDFLGPVIAKEELARAYPYGKSMVPITETDEKMMEKEEEKGMKLIGFYPADAVPREHMMSNILTVHSPDAPEAFAAFVHAMIDAQVVALVRYVRTANSSPKRAILIPVVKEDKYQCCYFAQIPFRDDVRLYQFAALPTSSALEHLAAGMKTRQPTVSQLQAVDDLINAHQLLEVDEDGEMEELRKPTKVYNPTYHRVFSCIRYRAMHPSKPDLPEIDEKLASPLKPNYSVGDVASQKRQAFKSAFSLEKVEPKQPKKAKTAPVAADSVPSLEEMLNREKESQKQKSHDEQEPETQKTPAKDPIIAQFNSMLDEPGDIIPEAAEFLIGKVREGVLENENKAFTIERLALLRSTCLSENESEKFNEFARELKGLYLEARMDSGLWLMMKNRQLGLVTYKEAEDSVVGVAEADQFFA